MPLTKLATTGALIVIDLQQLSRNGGVGSWLGTGATRLNVSTADDDQGEKGMEAGVGLTLFRLSYRR